MGLCPWYLQILRQAVTANRRDPAEAGESAETLHMEILVLRISSVSAITFIHGLTPMVFCGGGYNLTSAMSRFAYTVKDEKGKTVKGIVEALDKKQAVFLLHKRNYYVISLILQKQRQSNTRVSSYSVRFNDLVHFTRQLSSMINAGLTLIESLHIIQGQLTKPAMLKLVKQLEDDVSGGSGLGDAISKNPRIFPPIYIALVRAGEASGKMDVILSRLADNLEKSREFKNKLKSAMIYPAIVLGGIAIVGVIVMTVVFPKLTALYKEMNIELPLPTQILITVSGIFSAWWWLAGIIVAAGVTVFIKLMSTRSGKRSLDRIIINIPGVGNLVKQSTMVEMIRSLAILVDSGVPILTALDISKNATGNILYQEAFEDAAKKVEKGSSLSEAIAEKNLFLPIIIQMVAVGEQTGKLGDCLYRLANYFESETDMAIRSLTTIIEPLIMVILGLGVGFLVIAVLMPIYSLSTKF